MKKLLCLLLGTSLVLSSCGGAWSKGPENLDEQDDFKTVRIDKEYQLRLPKYLEKGGNMNPDASMEYQNPLREVYAMIIAEPKDVFVNAVKESFLYSDTVSPVQAYFDVQSQAIESNFIDPVGKSFKPNEFNGLPMMSREISGNFPETPVPIYYHLTAIEGKDRMYLLALWTLEDRKEKYKPTFEKIVKTFKELN